MNEGSEHYKAELIESFYATKPCCLRRVSAPAFCQRPGLARQLREADTRLDNPELHKFFWAWALCLTTSVADTERIHASNNRYIKSAGLWDCFTHTARTHTHTVRFHW